MPWDDTEGRRVSPTRAARLREEYGPSPWWDAEMLGELLEEHGLVPVEIAEVFRANPETIRKWIRRHRNEPRLGEFSTAH